MRIQNPVLRGFHPDPSLVRTGDGYYIATSTFEWFPGVCIFYSDDLADWELVSHGLTDDSLVDMTGIDSACGIWAPNLTYCDGTFYLMYTIVYTNRSRFKDTWNYLTTAKDVRGPWSKPVFLNCSGYDPSLFHDTDGPNIMKHDGWYYLVCAEGGTEFGHCSVMLRSRSIWGPYEEEPNNPVISSAGKDCLLQREVTFSIRYPGEEEEIAVGEALDMRNISDEHIEGNGFTGSMLGVNCVDVQGGGVFAEFTEIVYREY